MTRQEFFQEFTPSTNERVFIQRLNQTLWEQKCRIFRQNEPMAKYLFWSPGKGSGNKGVNAPAKFGIEEQT